MKGLQNQNRVECTRRRSIRLAIAIVVLFSTLVTNLRVQSGDYQFVVQNGAVKILAYTGPGGNVVIPPTINGSPVTIIGEFAFYNRPSITSVAIPDSVTAIESTGFGFSQNLTNVTIGKGVSSIADWAFWSCAKLTNIFVDVENRFYSSVDGVLFNKDQTTIVQYPSGKEGPYN